MPEQTNHLLSNAAISNASGGICPTVRVKHLETDAEILINTSDFDAEIHEKIDRPRKRLKPIEAGDDGEDDKKKGKETKGDEKK